MNAPVLIAAFLKDDRVHAARFAKNSHLAGLSYCEGWCGAEGGESPTIHYVPNWAFDGRDRHGDVAVCVTCSAALIVLAEPR